MSAKEKRTGLLFLVGQTVHLFVSCVGCGVSLFQASMRYKTLGICKTCLDNANIEVGTLLVLPAPTGDARNN